MDAHNDAAKHYTSGPLPSNRTVMIEHINQTFRHKNWKKNLEFAKPNLNGPRIIHFMSYLSKIKHTFPSDSFCNFQVLIETKIIGQKSCVRCSSKGFTLIIIHTHRKTLGTCFGFQKNPSEASCNDIFTS